MPNLNPPDDRPDFLQDLLTIRNDPRVTSLALRWARDPELAEDALQAAYCAVAKVAKPAAIRDLRPYFCRVLLREVHRLRGQLGAMLMEDFTSVADAHQDRSGGNLPARRPVAETVSTRLLAEGWLEPFASRRRELIGRVPGRSGDPRRYRGMIVDVAERVLRRIINDEDSDASCNAFLSTAYSEWFDEPGYAENTRHQRFRRAREDIRALLRTIIDPDDLMSLAGAVTPAPGYFAAWPSLLQETSGSSAEVKRAIAAASCLPLFSHQGRERLGRVK